MAKIVKLTKDTSVHPTPFTSGSFPTQTATDSNQSLFHLNPHTHTKETPGQKSLKGKCNIQFSGSKNKVITGLFQTYSFPECKSSFEQKF